MIIKKPVILATVAGSLTQGNGRRVREGCGMSEAQEMGTGFTVHTQFVSWLKFCKDFIFKLGLKIGNMALI